MGFSEATLNHVILLRYSDSEKEEVCEISSIKKIIGDLIVFTIRHNNQEAIFSVTKNGKKEAFKTLNGVNCRVNLYTKEELENRVSPHIINEKITSVEKKIEEYNKLKSTIKNEI